MDPATIGLVIGALLGGGGIASVVQGFTARKTAEADATATLSGVWKDTTDRLDSDIKELRSRILRVEKENAVYRALLIEHGIPIPVIPQDPRS